MFNKQGQSKHKQMFVAKGTNEQVLESIGEKKTLLNNTLRRKAIGLATF